MLNKKTYRETIDQLSFSADFEERTMQLLRQRTREAEKENTIMKFHSLRKLAITAAVVAALALSVSAALYFLSPADVADHYDQPLLAEAFQSEKAILLDETVQTGDYDVTLAGLVSGAGLTSWEANVDTSHTYAVLMVRRTDGQSIDKEELGITEYTATPLVGGYSPQAVNNWTLGAFATNFVQDGVLYYLLDTADLSIFANHTVYFAFYEGSAPNNAIFQVAEDGSIAFAEDFDGVQALFVLPLDKSLADDAAADAFVESTELNFWSNERTESEDNVGSYTFGEGGDSASYSFSTASGEWKQLTPEEYGAYIAEETERLRAQVEDGVLSQASFAITVGEMEENLAGLKAGSLIAAMVTAEDGSQTVFVGTNPDVIPADVQYQETKDGISMVIDDAKD